MAELADAHVRLVMFGKEREPRRKKTMSELQPSKKALVALRSYRKAVEEHAFLGAQPPAVWPAIVRDLEKAEAEIKKYLVRSDHDPGR